MAPCISARTALLAAILLWLAAVTVLAEVPAPAADLSEPSCPAGWFGIPFFNSTDASGVVRRCGLVVPGRLTPFDVDLFCRAQDPRSRSLSIHSHLANAEVWRRARDAGILPTRDSRALLTLGGVAGFGELAWFDHSPSNFVLPFFSDTYNVWAAEAPTRTNASGALELSAHDDAPRVSCLAMTANGTWTLINCEESRHPFACQITLLDVGTEPSASPAPPPSSSPAGSANASDELAGPPDNTPAPSRPPRATRPATLPTDVQPCADDWVPFNETGKCYRVFMGQNEATTQPRAELRCQTSGGPHAHLTSVLDAVEHEFIQRMLGILRAPDSDTGASLPFHIGARFMAGGAFGQWLEDGSWYPDYPGTSSPSWERPPRFRRWAAPAEPSKSFGCIAVDAASGDWLAADCLDRLPFICSYINVKPEEWPSASDTPSSSPAAPASPTASTGDETNAPTTAPAQRCVHGWLFSPESSTCSTLEPQLGSSGFRVNEDCAARFSFQTVSGARVRPTAAAVRSATEASLFASELLRRTADNISIADAEPALIGASFGDRGEFGMFADASTEWDAATATQLWAPGHPTAAFGCIALDAAGRWQSLPCSRSLPSFLCQYDAGLVAPGDVAAEESAGDGKEDVATSPPPASQFLPLSQRIKSLSGQTKIRVALGTMATYVLDLVDVTQPVPDGTLVIFSSAPAPQLCGSASQTKDISAVIGGEIAMRHLSLVDDGAICISEDDGRTFTPIVAPSPPPSSSNVAASRDGSTDGEAAAAGTLRITVPGVQITGVIPLQSPAFQPPQRIADHQQAVAQQRQHVEIEERASGALQLVGTAARAVEFVRLASGPSCQGKDALFTFGPSAMDLATDVVGYELIVVELLRTAATHHLDDHASRQAPSRFHLCISLELPTESDSEEIIADDSRLDAALNEVVTDETAALVARSARSLARRNVFFSATDIVVHMPHPTIELDGLSLGTSSSSSSSSSSVTIHLFSTPKLWLHGSGFRTGMSVLLTTDENSCSKRFSAERGNLAGEDADADGASPTSTIAPISFVGNEEGDGRPFVQLTTNQTGMWLSRGSHTQLSERLRTNPGAPPRIVMYMCIALSTFTPFLHTAKTIVLEYRTIDSVNEQRGATAVLHTGFNGLLRLGGLTSSLDAGLSSSLRVAFSTDQTCRNPAAFFGLGDIAPLHHSQLLRPQTSTSTDVMKEGALVLVVPPGFVTTPSSSVLRLCLSVGHTFDVANRRVFVPTAASIDIRPVRLLVLSTFAPPRESAHTTVTLPYNSRSRRDGLLLPAEGYGLGGVDRLLLSRTPCLDGRTYDERSNLVATVQLLSQNSGVIDPTGVGNASASATTRYAVVSPSALDAIAASKGKGLWVCLRVLKTEELVLPTPFRLVTDPPKVTDVQPQPLLLAVDQDVAVSGYGLEGRQTMLIPACRCGDVAATRLWRAPLPLQFARRYSSSLSARGGQASVGEAAAALGHHALNPETHYGRWFLHVAATNMLAAPPGQRTIGCAGVDAAYAAAARNDSASETQLVSGRWCFQDGDKNGDGGGDEKWTDAGVAYEAVPLTLEGFASLTDTDTTTRQFVVSQKLVSGAGADMAAPLRVSLRGTLTLLATSYVILLHRDEDLLHERDQPCALTPEQVQNLLDRNRVLVFHHGEGYFVADAVERPGVYDVCFASQLPLSGDSIAFTHAVQAAVIVVPAQPLLFSVNAARNVVVPAGALNAAGMLIPVDGLGLAGGSLAVLSAGQTCAASSQTSAAPAQRLMPLLMMPTTAPRTVSGNAAPFVARLVATHVPHNGTVVGSFPICFAGADGVLQPTASHVVVVPRAVTTINGVRDAVVSRPAPPAARAPGDETRVLTVRGVGMREGDVIMFGDASCIRGHRAPLLAAPDASISSSDDPAQLSPVQNPEAVLTIKLPSAVFAGTDRLLPMCAAAAAGATAWDVDAPAASFAPLLGGATLRLVRHHIAGVALRPVAGEVRAADTVGAAVQHHTTQRDNLTLATTRGATFTFAITAAQSIPNAEWWDRVVMALAPRDHCGAPAVPVVDSPRIFPQRGSNLLVTITAAMLDAAVGLLWPTGTSTLQAVELDLCMTDDASGAELRRFWPSGAVLVVNVQGPESLAPLRVNAIETDVDAPAGQQWRLTTGARRLPIDAHVFAEPRANDTAPPAHLVVRGVALVAGTPVHLLHLHTATDDDDDAPPLRCGTLNSKAQRQVLTAADRLVSLEVAVVDATGTRGRLDVTPAIAKKLKLAGPYFTACYEPRLSDRATIVLPIPSTISSGVLGDGGNDAAAVVAFTMLDTSPTTALNLVGVDGTTNWVVPFGFMGSFLVSIHPTNPAAPHPPPEAWRIAILPSYYSCAEAGAVSQTAGRLLHFGPSAESMHRQQPSVFMREADTLIRAARWRVCFSTDNGVSFHVTPVSFTIVSISSLNGEVALGRRQADSDLGAARGSRSGASDGGAAAALLPLYEATTRRLRVDTDNAALLWPGGQDLIVRLDTHPCTSLGSTAAAALASPPAARVSTPPAPVDAASSTALMRLPRIPSAYQAEQLQLRTCLSVDGGATFSEQLPRVWLSRGELLNITLVGRGGEASITYAAAPSIAVDEVLNEGVHFNVEALGGASTTVATAFLLLGCGTGAESNASAAAALFIDPDGDIGLSPTDAGALRSVVPLGTPQLLCFALVDRDPLTASDATPRHIFHAVDWPSTRATVRVLDRWSFVLRPMPANDGQLSIAMPWASEPSLSATPRELLITSAAGDTPLVLQRNGRPATSLLLRQERLGQETGASSGEAEIIAPISPEGLVLLPPLRLEQNYTVFVQLAASSSFVPAQTPALTLRRSLAELQTAHPRTVFPGDGVHVAIGGSNLYEGMPVEVHINDSISVSARASLRRRRGLATWTDSSISTPHRHTPQSRNVSVDLIFEVFLGPHITARAPGTILALYASTGDSPNGLQASHAPRPHVRIVITDDPSILVDGHEGSGNATSSDEARLDSINLRIQRLLDAAADPNIISVAIGTAGLLELFPAGEASPPLPPGSLVAFASSCEDVPLTGSPQHPLAQVVHGRLVNLHRDVTARAQRLQVCALPTNQNGARSQLRFTQLVAPSSRGGGRLWLTVVAVHVQLRSQLPHVAIFEGDDSLVDVAVHDPTWHEDVLSPGGQMPLSPIIEQLRVAVGAPCHALSSALAESTPPSAVLRTTTNLDPSATFNALLVLFANRVPSPQQGAASAAITSSSLCVSVDRGKRFTSMAVAVHHIRRTSSLMAVGYELSAAMTSGSTVTEAMREELAHIEGLARTAPLQALPLESELSFFAASGAATMVTDTRIRAHFTRWSEPQVEESRQQLMVLSRAVESFLWRGHVGLDAYIDGGILFMPPWSLLGGSVASLGEQPRPPQQLSHHGASGTETTVNTGITVVRRLPQLSCIGGRSHVTLHRGEPGRLLHLDSVAGVIAGDGVDSREGTFGNAGHLARCAAGIAPGTVLRVGCSSADSGGVGSFAVDLTVGAGGSLIVPRELSYLADIADADRSPPLRVCIKAFEPHMLRALHPEQGELPRAASASEATSGSAAPVAEAVHVSNELRDATFLPTPVVVTVSHTTFIDAVDGVQEGTLMFFAGEDLRGGLPVEGAGITARSLILGFAEEAGIGQSAVMQCRAIAQRRLEQRDGGAQTDRKDEDEDDATGHPLLRAWLPVVDRRVVLTPQQTATLVVASPKPMESPQPRHSGSGEAKTEGDGVRYAAGRFQVCFSADGGASFEPVDNLFVTVVPPTVVGYVQSTMWNEAVDGGPADVHFGSDGWVELGDSQPLLRVVASDFATPTTGTGDRLERASGGNAESGRKPAALMMPPRSYFAPNTTRFAIQGGLPTLNASLHVAFVQGVAACDGSESLHEKIVFTFQLRRSVTTPALYEIVEADGARATAAAAHGLWDPVMGELIETPSGVLCTSTDGGTRFFSANAVGPFHSRRLAQLHAEFPLAFMVDIFTGSRRAAGAAAIVAASPSPVMNVAHRRWRSRSQLGVVTARVDATRGGNRRADDVVLTVPVVMAVKNQSVAAGGLPPAELLRNAFEPRSLTNIRLGLAIRELLIEQVPGLRAVDIAAQISAIEPLAAPRVPMAASAAPHEADAADRGSRGDELVVVVTLQMQVLTARNALCDDIYEELAKEQSFGIDDPSAVSRTVLSTTIDLFRLASESQKEEGPTLPFQKMLRTFLAAAPGSHTATSAAGGGGGIDLRECEAEEARCPVTAVPLLARAAFSDGTPVTHAIARSLATAEAALGVRRLIKLRRQGLLGKGMPGGGEGAEGGGEGGRPWKFPQCPWVTPAALVERAAVHGGEEGVLVTEMADRKNTFSSIPVLLLIPALLILATRHIFKKHFDFNGREKVQRQAIRERLRMVDAAAVVVGDASR